MPWLSSSIFLVRVRLLIQLSIVIQNRKVLHLNRTIRLYIWTEWCNDVRLANTGLLTKIQNGGSGWTDRLAANLQVWSDPTLREGAPPYAFSVGKVTGKSLLSCCYPLSSLHVVLPLLQQLVVPSFPPLMVEVCRKNLRYILLSVIKLLGRFKYVVAVVS
jgi:hypothetical protein